jgi:ParB family transcriptional regulator, chromosome partitioning protein
VTFRMPTPPPVNSVPDRSPKRALGRGLSALIPQAGAVALSGEAVPGVLRLPLERIARDSAQPRKAFDADALRELADSIQAQGVIQPVLVRRDGVGYRLIAGERRWRAAQLAGLRDIPAIVREATESEAFALALVENLQRTDLNPIEEAEGYRRLVDEFGLTQEEVSVRVGKERSTVANAMRLLGLPLAVKEKVAAGALSMGHARALLGAVDAERTALAERVTADGLSVRETERLVQTQRRPAAAPGRRLKPSAGAASRALVEQLQRALGTKVRLEDRGGRGTLAIDFFSYEDLERIVRLLHR